MKVIGYIRVSTIEQADSGLSLTNQSLKIKAYCEALDLELTEIITDAGYSAKTLNRPGMNKTIELIKNKLVDGVVILKLDRLTRNVRDLGTMTALFEKTNVSLISVQDSINTSTAAGRLVLNVLGSVAQWESEAIGERTKAALSVKKAKGELVGSVPYGYDLARNGKTLIINELEQNTLKLIRTLRGKGLTLRKIGIELDKRGIITKKGGKWQPKTISNFCKEVSL